MSRMRIGHLVGTLTLAILAATPALAAHGEKGDWEFGPYGGLVWLDDYDILNPKDDALFGGRVGYFFTSRWSLEGSFQRLASDTEVDSSLGLNDEDFDVLSPRLNVLYNFNPGGTLRPFVTLGVGSEVTDAHDLGDSTDTGVNGGGGLRWFLTDHFGLRLDGRYVSTAVGGGINERQNNMEGTVGVLWSLGGGPPPDTDKDGVADRKDKCPDTPVGAKVDENGCPVDTDGDGVADGIDQCPDTPKGWPVDAKGCPRDTDGDGVPDGSDACPDTPKGAKVDSRGCPADSDGDGVLDGLDRCPDTPRGATVDGYGCPLDADHDGVYDGLDKCPDTPHGAKVDADGCPIVEKAAPLFETQKVLVLEGVNFETNSATLTPGSETTLEKVAASLRDWPDVSVEIGGHTDSTGSAGHNLELSQRRANSVKAYLEAKGIDPARMTTKGYGERKPIADNSTSEGKARNRRVELTKRD